MIYPLRKEDLDVIWYAYIASFDSYVHLLSFLLDFAIKGIWWSRAQFYFLSRYIVVKEVKMIYWSAERAKISVCLFVCWSIFSFCVYQKLHTCDKQPTPLTEVLFRSFLVHLFKCMALVGDFSRQRLTWGWRSLFAVCATILIILSLFIVRSNSANWTWTSE